MRIIYEHSHFGGSEILQVNHPGILVDIDEVIASVALATSNMGHEQTMQEQPYCTPGDMHAQFKSGLRDRGFHEAGDGYSIATPQYDSAIDGAYRRMLFVKDKVYIRIQYGRYSSMFYDMNRFQYFYKDGKAEVGVEIVPAHSPQGEISSGASGVEQLVCDIECLKHHFPAVPVMMILVDV